MLPIELLKSRAAALRNLSGSRDGRRGEGHQLGSAPPPVPATSSVEATALTGVHPRRRRGSRRPTPAPPWRPPPLSPTAAADPRPPRIPALSCPLAVIAIAAKTPRDSTHRISSVLCSSMLVARSSCTPSNSNAYTPSCLERPQAWGDTLLMWLMAPQFPTRLSTEKHARVARKRPNNRSVARSAGGGPPCA